MFHRIYILPWHYIFLLMPIITILASIFAWTVKRFIPKPTWIYAILFIICLGIVFNHTVFDRNYGDFSADFRLFGSYIRALDEAELYRANFMNILLFFPGGLMFALALQDVKKGWKRFLIVVCTLCLMSVVIEATQYFFSLGMAETDDVLHNTLGAVFGYGAARLVEKVTEKSGKKKC